MADQPLVSCLCVTRNRVPLLRRAVSCFLRQTYQPCELVVVHDADDTATRDYLRTLCVPSIRPVVVPARPRRRLGSLRNLAIKASVGDYIAQWDDDDWYRPTRLAEQMDALHKTGKQGCVLLRVIVYDMDTGSAFISFQRTWEGSLVAERTAVPPYPDLSRLEDTPVLDQMFQERRLVLLDTPDLYIYVYHGANTWPREHFVNLFRTGQRLTPEETAYVAAQLKLPADPG